MWPWPPANRRWRAATRRACSATCRKFLERAGPGEEGSGSITGVFSVLVDGDDHNDPVADNIRGTLDGHIVLDRAIADQGRFPAVNVLTSISRLAKAACTPEQWSAGHEAARHDRALRGHARSAPDRRLSQRLRRRSSTRRSSWCRGSTTSCARARTILPAWMSSRTSRARWRPSMTGRAATAKLAPFRWASRSGAPLAGCPGAVLVDVARTPG